MTAEVMTQTDVSYSKLLADSNLLPKQYQRQPANVLYAVSYGRALGIPAMTAIMGINVIQGKPSLSADLMAALIRRGGHRLRVLVAGDQAKPDTIVATAFLIRADDPDFTYTAEWTLAKAKAAKLTDKDNWRNYPAAMLKARAISEVAREGASEVLHGLIYTPDELGDDSNPGDGTIVADEATPTEDVVDGELVDDEQVGRDRMNALLKERFANRDDRRSYVDSTLGRFVEKADDLTPEDVTALLDALEADTEQPTLDGTGEDKP